MKYADAVKERVDALLEETGLKATDLIDAMGIGTSTYYEMWKNGYVTVDRLGAMAEALGVPAARLLPATDQVTMHVVGEPQVPYSTGRPMYLEERIAALEKEVRKLTSLEAEVRKLKEKNRPR